MSLYKAIPVEAVPGVEPPESQFSYPVLCKFSRESMGRWVYRKSFFSDKTTFHVSEKINRHNVYIWGIQNAHEFV